MVLIFKALIDHSALEGKRVGFTQDAIHFPLAFIL